MVCVAPGLARTVEDRACCGTMKNEKNDCGQKAATLSHVCCKQPLGTPVLPMNPVSFHPAVADTLRVLPSDFFPRHGSASGWFYRRSHAPPKPAPDIVSALKV